MRASSIIHKSELAYVLRSLSLMAKFSFRFGTSQAKPDALPRDIQESHSHWSDWGTSDEDSRRGSASPAARKESTFSTFSLVVPAKDRSNSVHTLGMKGLRKRSVPEEEDHQIINEKEELD